MEQEGERLKSYSTAVYFHRVHEIYFPQLAEQWKYLLSIQWRYFETRVKQRPDQHGAGAHRIIINGKKNQHKTNKPTTTPHWKLTHSAQKAALLWRCFISEPHLGDLINRLCWLPRRKWNIHSHGWILYLPRLCTHSPTPACFPITSQTPSQSRTSCRLTGGRGVAKGASLSQKLSENANLVIFPGQTKAEAARLCSAVPRVNWHF